jgi:antirestriction protein ArdC
MKGQTMRTDIYQKITDQIVSELEKGTRPWLKPWNAEHAAGRITRPLRGNGVAYRGMNVLMLWSAAMDRGYVCPTWMTFKQALELKAHVRKGERGSLVVYADKIIRAETDTATGESSETAIPFMKGYTVFNVEQIDGLPERFYAKAEPRSETVQRIATAETFFAATRATVRHGGNMAFYSVTHDHVQMPPIEAFRDSESYYATLAHETIHYADLRIMPRRCRSCGQVSRVSARHVGIIGLTEQAVVVPGSESNGTGILGEACGRSARVFLAAASLPDYRGDFRSWERTGRARCGGTIHACDPNRAWHAARRIQMIRPWLRRVDALSRSSINSANPDRYLPRPIAKATETRTCKTLPDGQPSSPEQHQASD